MKFGWAPGEHGKIFAEPLCVDDFESGQRFLLLPWAYIGLEDVNCFASATGDANPLHFDSLFAETTVLAGLAVHGELVMNTLFGALHYVNFWSGTLEALLEKYVKFFLPVRPGDRVKHFLHVMEVRESKKHPDKGMVKFEFFMENQKSERVAGGWFCVLMKRRSPGTHEEGVV